MNALCIGTSKANVEVEREKKAVDAPWIRKTKEKLSVGATSKVASITYLILVKNRRESHSLLFL